MLDALDNPVPCTLSQHGGSFNEINDLHRILGNPILRRSSFGGS